MKSGTSIHIGIPEALFYIVMGRIPETLVFIWWPFGKLGDRVWADLFGGPLASSVTVFGPTWDRGNYSASQTSTA